MGRPRVPDSFKSGPSGLSLRPRNKAFLEREAKRRMAKRKKIVTASTALQEILEALEDGRDWRE